MAVRNATTQRAISEPLTYKWSHVESKLLHDSNQVIFADLNERELRESGLTLTLAMSVRTSLSELNGTVKKSDSVSAYEIRKPYAYGHVNLSDTLRDISNKETREVLFHLLREEPSSRPQPQSAKQLQKHIPMSTSDIFEKIPIAITVQLLSGSLSSIPERYPNLFAMNPPRALQRLHCDQGAAILDRSRNEFYIHLGTADLHMGKNEKSIEAVLTVSVEPAFSEL